LPQLLAVGFVLGGEEQDRAATNGDGRAVAEFLAHVHGPD
jgi:hypothetical protein